MRHGEIQQQHIGLRSLHSIVHFSAITDRSHDRVCGPQELAESVAHERVIVGDEDRWTALHSHLELLKSPVKPPDEE
jgi:hypothetical protein